MQAQRVRLTDSFVVPAGQQAPQLIPNTGPFVTQPGATSVLSPQQGIVGQPGFPQTGAPINVPPNINTQPVLPQLQNPFPQTGGVVPGTTFGQPGLIQPGVNQVPGLRPSGFDPFAVQPQTMPPPGAIIQGFPGGSPQSIQPPPYIYPPPAGGNTIPNAPGYGAPAGYGTGYGYNSNGSWSNSGQAWPSQAWARLRSSNIYRLLERPRWRHTYLSPDSSSGRGLGVNETDVATTLSIPNFLYSSQPVRISPGFIFHFWDGPDTVTTGADLPGQTYSVYLANDFSTPWNRRFGAELNLTVGLYTDFQEVTTDSIRISGLGLGWFRLNNTTTFKLGVEYLDRLDVKLLPAGGFFIYPTPDLKLDLYFPRPKIAQRLPNLGNFEVWAYLGGEYGGGSWTIKRIGNVGDQADVNDIRTFVGLEWMGPRQVTGFAEIGYVFDREIIYRSAPNTDIDIDDTFMIRAGIAF